MKETVVEQAVKTYFTEVGIQMNVVRVSLSQQTHQAKRGYTP